MKRNLPLIILLICVAAFALGIAQLFKLRFETGDVYPPYSSLRTDPLGTSAFYESLDHIHGINVERDFRMSDQLPEGKTIAYLHLAGNTYDWDEVSQATFKEIQRFLKDGGRLVIAFEPYTSRVRTASPTNTPPGLKPKQGTKSAKFKPKKSHDPSGSEKYAPEDAVSLKERFGFGFGFKPLKKGDDAYQPLEVTNRDEPSLPASISWHSGLVLTNLDDSWDVIYARDSDAVLVERKFGPGSLVLSTDSYFLSNEAMSKDRHAELLSWVVGPCHHIYFDEAHLGIVDEPGIAKLMRSYRLHGLVAGLLLLAGLFIWKNSVSFAPPHEDEQVELAVAGKDSATGFVNLLRRNVKSVDLLNLCVAEWKKSLMPGKFTATRVAKVESVLNGADLLPPQERNPITLYRTICQALKDRSGFRVPVSELESASSSQQQSELNSAKTIKNHRA